MEGWVSFTGKCLEIGEPQPRVMIQLKSFLYCGSQMFWLVLIYLPYGYISISQYYWKKICDKYITTGHGFMVYTKLRVYF